MANIRLRRMTNAQRLALATPPAAGEPVWTTDTQKLYVGDGSTLGGVPVQKPSALLDRIVIRYDNSIYDKNTYLANYNDNGQAISDWFFVTPFSAGLTAYFNEGDLGVLDLRRAFSYEAGFYNVPAYSSDKSITKMQFCIANYEATSAEINARLAALSLSVEAHGTWWEGASKVAIPVIQAPGRHPYSILFVRFVNQVAPSQSSTTPQPIKQFGGNCNFSPTQLTVYKSIKYKEVVQ